MISIGILGGTGYTGKKLIQYLIQHPFVEDFQLYGKSSAGEKLHNIFPELCGYTENLQVRNIEEISDEHDVYFIALPHGEALKFVPQLISGNNIVIDLGGDYRLDSADEYFQWYKITHTSPELLKSKIYGLADYTGTSYESGKLIANPGCYPTSVLLGLLPLVSEFTADILSVSCVSYSGTSGAGKSSRSDLMLSEMYGNVKAYYVNEHRHQPEILQQLSKSGFNSPFSFTTHLLPAVKGIYTTASVHLTKAISKEEIENVYKAAYQNSPFVRMRNTPPELQWVVDSNFCDINVSVKDKVLVLTSTIDNLVKGASGQAIQNMNKLFGWDETTGLLKKELKYA